MIAMMTYMKCSSVLIHRILMAGVALIYVVLSVMSAGCTLAHADRVQAHHHHSEDRSSPQNAYCAWACQVTSDVVEVAQPLPAVTWLVVEQQILVPDSHFLPSASTALHPRAPPIAVFLSHG